MSGAVRVLQTANEEEEPLCLIHKPLRGRQRQACQAFSLSGLVCFLIKHAIGTFQEQAAAEPALIWLGRF